MVYTTLIGMLYLCKLYCARVWDHVDRELSRRVCIIGSVTVLFLFAAFRGLTVGIDTLNYVEKFELIRRYSIADILTSLYTERIEFGYALLNKLVSLFIPNARAVIILSAALICYGMAYAIWRYTDEDITPVILFVCSGLYLASFNVTRQVLACVLLFNAWGALTQKQYRRSLILWFAAFSCHVFSIVFAAVYFFWFFRGNKKLVTAVFLVSLVVSINYQFFIDILASLTSAFSYLDNSRPKTSAGGIWALWALELMICGFFALYYYAFKPVNRFLSMPQKLRSSENFICIPIFVVYYVLFSYLGTRFNYLDRIGLFFQPFMILLFLNAGKFLKSWSPVLHKIYLVGMHVCFVFYFFLTARADQYYYLFVI